MVCGRGLYRTFSKGGKHEGQPSKVKLDAVCFWIKKKKLRWTESANVLTGPANLHGVTCGQEGASLSIPRYSVKDAISPGQWDTGWSLIVSITALLTPASNYEMGTG